MASGETIASAFVDIRPAFDKFAGELSKGIKGGVDSGVSGASGSLDKLASVGKAAFLGIAGAAVAFGVAAVHAAVEGEKAQAGLALVVKNTGTNFDQFEPKVKALSERFAGFGYQNDQVELGLTRLIGITGNTSTAITLMGTAADLAAARHLSLEQAAQLVGRAADGNVTALKRMGIEIATTGDKAVDGAAAIAALNDRFGGAAQAQSETFAGKVAALRARISNLTEEVGTHLLPVLTDLIGAGVSTINFFERNTAAAIALGVAVGGPLLVAMGAYVVQQTIAIGLKAADFFETVAIAALYAAGGLKAAAVAVQAFVVSLTVGIGPVYLAAAAVGLLTGAITLNSTHTKEAKDAASSYVETIKGSGDEVGILKGRIETMSKARDAEYLATEKAATANGNWAEVSGKARAKYDQETAAINVLNDRVKEITSSQKGAKLATEDLQQSQDKEGLSLDDLATKTGLTTTVVQALADKLKIDLTKATQDQVKSITDLAARTLETSAPTLKLRDAMVVLADKTADATEKASAFKTALDLVIGGNIDAEKAVINFEQSISDLGEKLKTNGTELDLHTQKGRDNRTAIEDTVVAIRNHIEAMQNSNVTGAALQGQIDADTVAFRNQLAAAGFTKTQIDELVRSYNLVPHNIPTVITADTSQAKKAVNDLTSGYSALANFVAKIPFIGGGGASGPIPPHFLARGGYFPGNDPQWAVVGDSREVMLPLDDPSRVRVLLNEAGLLGGSAMPNSGGTGGGAVTVEATITQTFTGPTTPAELRAAMVDVLDGHLGEVVRRAVAGAGRLP